jgi:muconolactone delta-isomerase
MTAGPPDGSMDYLVTMTTHVPPGTSEQAIADMRTREAERSRQLAAAGRLRRLWRPPLQPGEWRTLGLFTASSEDELERTLTSMPLRVWRTDEVTPLAQHPHDPAPGRVAGRTGVPEFLTTLVVEFPPQTPAEQVTAVYEAEGARSHELGDLGFMLRLWRLPGERRALVLWQAHDRAQLEEMLQSLPLAPWISVETVPLTAHPSDPALQSVPAPR